MVPIEVRVHLRPFPVYFPISMDHLEGRVILHTAFGSQVGLWALRGRAGARRRREGPAAAAGGPRDVAASARCGAVGLAAPKLKRRRCRFF